MAYRASGYQYETSPRKLKPEYAPQKNPYSKKKKSTAKKRKVDQNFEQEEINEKQKKLKAQKQNKKNLKMYIKTSLYIVTVFSVLFAISYRYSLITQQFEQKEQLKDKLSVLQKENKQLEISIQNSLNLSNIEKSASSKLGMKKIDESQKVYVNLPKKDYVEPASEKVIVLEEKKWYEKLWESIVNLF